MAKKARLAVTDAAAIDTRRRLVLLRRDDVEHLILIGGPTDMVIESDIRRSAPARPLVQNQMGNGAHHPAGQQAPATQPVSEAIQPPAVAAAMVATALPELQQAITPQSDTQVAPSERAAPLEKAEPVSFADQPARTDGPTVSKTAAPQPRETPAPAVTTVSTPPEPSLAAQATVSEKETTIEPVLDDAVATPSDFSKYLATDTPNRKSEPASASEKPIEPATQSHSSPDDGRLGEPNQPSQDIEVKHAGSHASMTDPVEETGPSTNVSNEAIITRLHDDTASNGPAPLKMPEPEHKEGKKPSMVDEMNALLNEIGHRN